MAYDFEWETGDAENQNYESFGSFDASIPQRYRSRSGGRFGGVVDEQEAEYGDTESSYSAEGFLGDYENEYGDSETEYGDTEAEAEEAESVFDEAEEMDLAAELLSLSNEQEVDQFIGKIIHSAGRAVGSVISGPIGYALASLLKAAARHSLPMFRRSRRGDEGRVFGLEVEGLSGEDQDFEFARRFVRLGGAAGGRAVRTFRRAAPATTARRALMAAARRFAPGLLRRLAGRARWRGYPRPYRPGSRPGYAQPYPYPYAYPQQPQAQPDASFPQQAPGVTSSMGAMAGGDGGQGQGAPDTSGPDTGMDGPFPQSGQWSRQGRQLTIHL